MHSDIFSLGCIIGYVFAHHPFGFSFNDQLLDNIENCEIQRGVMANSPELTHLVTSMTLQNTTSR